MGKSLRIKCKSCNDWFASPIQMDEQTFKNAVLRNNYMQCGYCGNVSSYDKQHMKFM